MRGTRKGKLVSSIRAHVNVPGVRSQVELKYVSAASPLWGSVVRPVPKDRRRDKLSFHENTIDVYSPRRR